MIASDPHRRMTLNKRRRIYVSAAGTAILVLAVAATDLVVERTAEQRIAEVAECRLGAEVEAELDSSFAGLRSVTGHVGTVRLDAARLQRNGVTLGLRVDLHGVSTDGEATGGSAVAAVPYAELGKRLGSAAGSGGAVAMDDVTLGPDGSRLVLHGFVGDLHLPVSVAMDLSTTSRAVTLTPRAVRMLGREVSVSALPALAGEGARLKDELKPRTLKIDRLPAGVRLTGAEVADDGLVLRFALSPSGLDLGKETGAGAVCVRAGE
ncbi:LmeA family phospholipid-binding protein [Streptomyces sp. NPDC001595]|uniref:LmeA family phospholipid-binding protein n=1 Tax=Streptomyces sp. NPDC001532 TaxID=3154520 RepID=UPI00331FFFCF